MTKIPYPAAAVIFAVALLCAGQTASITATLAGQIVSEGFIEWRVSVGSRLSITRANLALMYPLALPAADDYSNDRARTVHGRGYSSRPIWLELATRCIPSCFVCGPTFRRFPSHHADFVKVGNESQEATQS